MGRKKRVQVIVYVPQRLNIAYDPKTGVASASMSFIRLRRKKDG